VLGMGWKNSEYDTVQFVEEMRKSVRLSHFFNGEPRRLHDPASLS
jgi:hypothetical protein